MRMAMVGLGRMGANMRHRLENAGITVSGYDANPQLSEFASLADLVACLPAGQRIVWVMVPAGTITQTIIDELSTLLTAGDIVIDGGNSHFLADIDNAHKLAAKGIDYVDCGVSGGIWGRENGYGLMAGGADKTIAQLMPIFDALRPAGPREDGFVHAGPVGAGHFAKMVHNGIEYGLMQSYAEGFELLEAQQLVTDVPGVLRAWTSGTVIRSWLLDLLVRAVNEDPHLDSIDDYVADSGEGRWTVDEAIEQSVPLPVISAALFARFSSRQVDSPAMKAVAALRHQFGGHTVKPAG